MPRAVVCDDAPGFRALIAALLGEAGMEVVGQGETWSDAERLARDADVVAVDLWMPEFDRAALTRVREAAPAATLAVITALAAAAAEHVGDVRVDLLLSKSAAPDETVAAIAAHARGR